MKPAITHRSRQRPSIGCLLPTLVALALLSSSASAQSSPAASVQADAAHGLQTVEFTAQGGKIRVFLPDDMAAGDTISGTVSAEPDGRSEPEQTANRDVLRGYVVDIGGQKIDGSKPTFTCVVPAAMQAVRIALAKSADRPGARPLGKIDVPLASPARSSQETTRMAQTPLPFDWPPVAKQGAPVKITGPFDGNSANTRVTVGGAETNLLAESPRQAVFAAPSGGRVGPTELEVAEGPTSTRGTIRIVQVQLSAPKTNLRSGEKTVLSVEVTGLRGLDYAVPVQLRTKGSVEISGGKLQRFDIHPGDPGVVRSGTFHTERTLTASTPGGFEVVADVVWAQPRSDGLVGKIVHVEGEPGGQPGRWRVPAILPGGKEKFGVYFGGDKPPALHYCNWIEIKSAEEKDGVDYVTEYVRTADPTRKPKTPPAPPTESDEAKPPAPPPGPGAAGGGEKTEPPPCAEGTMRVLGSEEKKFTVLDGKQEMFLHLYTDKDRAAIAARDFADYLKGIADAGDKAGDLLPDGDGAGGATVGFLLKSLDQGSAVINAVLAGKLKLAGASEFTAAMDIGLRDIVATCGTLEFCRRGVWVTEKRFGQTETKRRETFVKKATKSDDEWERIADSSGHIDPAKAAQWADDFFRQQANILKGNYDDLKAFKDRCK